VHIAAVPGRRAILPRLPVGTLDRAARSPWRRDSAGSSNQGSRSPDSRSWKVFWNGSRILQLQQPWRGQSLWWRTCCRWRCVGCTN